MNRRLCPLLLLVVACGPIVDGGTESRDPGLYVVPDNLPSETARVELVVRESTAERCDALDQRDNSTVPETRVSETTPLSRALFIPVALKQYAELTVLVYAEDDAAEPAVVATACEILTIQPGQQVAVLNMAVDDTPD